MHRITVWYDLEGAPRQWSAACLDQDWEAHCEVTEPLGPFCDLPSLRQCVDVIHRAFPGPSGRAHQLALF